MVLPTSPRRLNMRCPGLDELPSPPPGKRGWPWTEQTGPLPAQMNNGRPWPRISIVTPSFNQCRFIEETIRSVLLQGYPDLEYIIIDGGSTDGSADIIRKYEPWLASWTSGPDRGQSDAVNKGWQRASGEIVAYLNSDDTYQPGALARAAECFAAWPDTLLAYGDAGLIDEDSARLRNHRMRPLSMLQLVCWHPLVPQPAVFLRRSALQTAGGLDPALHYVMDYDLWVRVARRGRFRHIPARLANMRRHADAKTVAHPERQLAESVAVIERLFVEANFPGQADLYRSRALAAFYLRQANALAMRGDRRRARASFADALRSGLPWFLAARAAIVGLKLLIGVRPTSWVSRLKRRAVQRWLSR
jgi:glycosyltransferase involved in cell wall biosynthesis